VGGKQILSDNVDQPNLLINQTNIIDPYQLSKCSNQVVIEKYD